MVNKTERKVDGLLFDKDGTLFEFSTTWDTWAIGVIRDLAAGSEERRRDLAREMHFDLEMGQFLPSSPIIAGTNREAAECVARAMPGKPIEEIEIFLMESAALAPLAPAVPLAPFLGSLSEMGLVLGVMTNDAESVALAQLGSAGVRETFDFIAGFDSGYGAKPAPDPLLAFAKHVGLSPARVAMVGDSTHDLMAGRAAGMQTIAVLTGMAEAAELTPYADVVLPDIGHIPDWLTLR